MAIVEIKQPSSARKLRTSNLTPPTSNVKKLLPEFLRSQSAAQSIIFHYIRVGSLSGQS